MNEETIYDEIKAVVYIDGYKALKIELVQENRHLWIPYSVIENINDIDKTQNEEEQILRVALWYLKKYQINGWS